MGRLENMEVAHPQVPLISDNAVVIVGTSTIKPYIHPDNYCLIVAGTAVGAVRSTDMGSAFFSELSLKFPYMSVARIM